MNKHPEVIPFKSNKDLRKVRANEEDGAVIDSGKINDLAYEVYQRGCIHIYTEDKSLIFKKDCDLFENEILNLDLNNLTTGQVKIIKGSGDNDNLVFTCKDGDIKVTLEKRNYKMVEKLRTILGQGIKSKAIGA